MPDSDTPATTCTRCGEAASNMHNERECHACWVLRKLDRPAAMHWAEVAAAFVSNVDGWDITAYLPSCGLTSDEMQTMLEAARKVRDHSLAVLGRQL